ncbi:MAG: hypothetical protein OSJ37_10830, partial [Muribaculaceae bacterium]|nr:hypothetical protein [Muribaculaceae bacterium]
MQPDNSINSTPTINAVNSDNTVNSTNSTNTDNLFDNEQTVSLSTDTTELPKQQRIGKQQRKSDYADFKATYLTPSKLLKR